MTIEEFLKMRQDRKLISVKEAAYMLGYTEQNIYKLYNTGKLNGVKISTGKIFIYKDSADNLLQESEID